MPPPPKGVLGVPAARIWSHTKHRNQLIVRTLPPPRPPRPTHWIERRFGFLFLFGVFFFFMLMHGSAPLTPKPVVCEADGCRLEPLSPATPHTGTLQPFERQEKSMFLPVFLEETKQSVDGRVYTSSLSSLSFYFILFIFN